MKIAEIGGKFLGDMQLAEKMIKAAATAGATHVKFQYWRETNLKNGKWDEDGRREIYKSAQLNDEKINFLIKLAKKNNLISFYSVFSISELEKLKDLGENIKIPSHEIYNLNLIKKSFQLFDFVLLSTGACSEEELIEAVSLSKTFKAS